MFLVSTLLAAASATACQVPPAAMARQIALPYEQFDEAKDLISWRRLNDRGCTDAAIRLLGTYDTTNSSKLSLEQKSELAFHRAQVLAFGGRDGEAIPHIEQALRVGGSEEWTTYVAATLAFLRRDRAALRQARDRYQAIAAGSMRLKILDGFVACPAETYLTAAHCAM